jgi:hypothetical protein
VRLRLTKGRVHLESFAKASLPHPTLSQRERAKEKSGFVLIEAAFIFSEPLAVASG